MLESFETFRESWANFGTLPQQAYFYYKCDKWLKVGTNLAVNERCILKWFKNKNRVYVTKDE